MKIKHYYQRIRHGYSDYDLWQFRDYLAEMIPKALRRLKEKHVGCPSDLHDEKAVNNECHKWKEILEEIALGFEATQDMSCMRFVEAKGGGGTIEFDRKEEIQKVKKFERAMDLLKEHYFNLWD